MRSPRQLLISICLFSFRFPLVPRSRQESSSLFLDSGSVPLSWNFFCPRRSSLVWHVINGPYKTTPSPLRTKYSLILFLYTAFALPLDVAAAAHLPQPTCTCRLPVTHSYIDGDSHVNHPTPYHSIAATHKQAEHHRHRPFQKLAIIQFCRQQFTQAPRDPLPYRLRTFPHERLH